MAAEAAGSAPRDVSAVALFKTCIEGFDIVVTSENFTEDYEQLCALFSLQRARFGLWGESVGLVPSPHDGRRLRYDKNLDRADIKPRVEELLNLVKSSLDEAGRVDERSGLKPTPKSSQLPTSRGLDIFKDSFERFKSRVGKDQKEVNSWTVTRLAIHNAPSFENQISRLKGLVDGLESITISLGLLEQQHARLREEIESISDTRSLRLLRDASSRHSSSQQVVSDTASQRLLDIVGSYVERQSGETIFTCSVVTATTGSFVTARTRPSGIADQSIEDHASLSVISMPTEVDTQRSRPAPPLRRQKERAKPAASCAECLEEHYKCVSNGLNVACARCVQRERICSFVSNDTVQDIDATLDALDLNPERDVENLIRIDPSSSVFSTDVPQNQRLLSDLLGKAKPRTALSFKMGDVHYGEQLRKTKEEDSDRWINNSGKIIAQANSGSSAAKRMFLELRDIRAGKVPFVSATPIDDSLDRVLASIEGPPETPYEGGIFWITVKLSVTDPSGPPLMRFHTKIYHPNISPQGHICADYKDKWNAVLSAGFSTVPVKDPSAAWFSGNSKQVKWSLGALLTALCGLLASPDVEDPLVPEIAMKYLEDYDDYCRSAKLFTKKWATGQRPDETNLLFLEDNFSEDLDTWKPDLNVHERPPSIDVASIQESLRKIYDDKAVTKFGDPINSTMDHQNLGATSKSSPNLHFFHELLDRGSESPGGLQYHENGKLEQFFNPQVDVSLETLIHATRENLQARGVAEEDLSRTSVCFALYQELFYLISSSDERQVIKDWYDYFREYFLGLLADGTVELSRASHLGGLMEFEGEYQLSISKDGIPTWRLSRTWSNFRSLNKYLADFVGPSLWSEDENSNSRGYQGWVHELPDEIAPNSSVMIPLLEFGLKILFSLHSRHLLGFPSFLSFLAPGGPGKMPSDVNNWRSPSALMINSEMKSDPLRYTNVAAFIPAILFEGTVAQKIVIKGNQWSYAGNDIILRLETSSPKSWLVICGDYNTSNSFDPFTIRDLAYSYSLENLPELDLSCHDLCLSLSYLSKDRTGGDYNYPREYLHLFFSNQTDCALWFEVLDLFQRLAPFA